MKIHRFFLEKYILDTELVLRDPSLVNQIGRVLRVRRGEVVALCNGEGEDSRYTITKINEEEVHLTLVERVASWVPEKKITIYLAPIRKEHFEWALEKCTEIGATAFVPLLTERSERGVVKRERAEAVIREAAEQCGRGDLPHYGEPVELTTLSGTEYLVLDMGGLGLESVGQTSKDIRVLIGPEGGWTDAERAHFAKQGVQSFSLGATTLRAETAAVVACARLIGTV